MGTGSVDIEKTLDLHTTTGVRVFRLRRTLAGVDQCPPSPWWTVSLERLLMGAAHWSPGVVEKVLIEHRPDLLAWLDGLPKPERSLALGSLWTPLEDHSDPSEIPPDP